RLFLHEAGIEADDLAVALELDRDGVAFTADDAPLDTRAHAAPFRDGFAIDFQEAIARLQKLVSGRGLIHLADDGGLFRFALGAPDAPHDHGKDHGQTETE